MRPKDLLPIPDIVYCFQVGLRKQISIAPVIACGIQNYDDGQPSHMLKSVNLSQHDHIIIK